jgi:hypothetical protein
VCAPRGSNCGELEGEDGVDVGLGGPPADLLEELGLRARDRRQRLLREPEERALEGADQRDLVRLDAPADRDQLAGGQVEPRPGTGRRAGEDAVAVDAGGHGDEQVLVEVRVVVELLERTRQLADVGAQRPLPRAAVDHEDGLALPARPDAAVELVDQVDADAHRNLALRTRGGTHSFPSNLPILSGVGGPKNKLLADAGSRAANAATRKPLACQSSYILSNLRATLYCDYETTAFRGACVRCPLGKLRTCRHSERD